MVGPDAVFASREQPTTSDVTWFAQDWRCWDEAQDEGALACLGWKRLVVKSEKSYRITLQLIKKRRSR